MLSAAELEAMAPGTKVYDNDGDELTRVEGGWRYSHFDHPLLPTGDLVLYYAPVTPEWQLQARYLLDFYDIYQRMTDEEKVAVSAIVNNALHRVNNERKLNDVE